MEYMRELPLRGLLRCTMAEDHDLYVRVTGGEYLKGHFVENSSVYDYIR